MHAHVFTQAVLSLFNGQIRKAVQAGIGSALKKDVPKAVNQVCTSCVC
jgi:hypothetical protein